MPYVIIDNQSQHVRRLKTSVGSRLTTTVQCLIGDPSGSQANKCDRRSIGRNYSAFFFAVFISFTGEAGEIMNTLMAGRATKEMVTRAVKRPIEVLDILVTHITKSSRSVGLLSPTYQRN